ncbi:anaerobic ribonucleoside-triphosphate reductase activating protein [Hathewaya histolytica]|uniref:Anaerobic ribonucleoside-triphosphate reductase-activating protein n=1 Tax=Hathewaya histolytica TaxID=1498 RepID=A0A4U9RQU1_HATHI|nr:anaerobic ribonucleoside-triphosphate reductase activating protein [Hathewaya histolytica]VTQ94449.1 anaerobic ribonucleoside-triphosphate reductase activating protein [Hathewaya histolytica]
MNTEDRNIRLSGIIFESLANGPGIRRVFFSQGCTHNCEGCFNKHTHSFHGGEIFSIKNLIDDLKDNPIINGVTFSGGDPLEQAESFYYLAQEVKNLGLNIWCYTGYTFEYILKHLDEKAFWKELLDSIDVIVDGRFMESQKNHSLKYRGSRNQRIIDVKKSLELGKIIQLNY